MIYPLVREMAAAGAPVRVPVAVACRVLGFTEQAYDKWLKQPVSAREVEEAHLIGVLRELHEDDPEGGYRVLSDDITELGYQLSERVAAVPCGRDPLDDHDPQTPVSKSRPAGARRSRQS